MDFKYRITDLLEIYLIKSKNPKHFFSSLSPILDHLKENLADKSKINYADRCFFFLELNEILDSVNY